MLVFAVAATTLAGCGAGSEPAAAQTSQPPAITTGAASQVDNKRACETVKAARHKLTGSMFMASSTFARESASAEEIAESAVGVKHGLSNLSAELTKAAGQADGDVKEKIAAYGKSVDQVIAQIDAANGEKDKAKAAIDDPAMATAAIVVIAACA